MLFRRRGRHAVMSVNPFPVELAVVNGGAEQGVTGWTNTTGVLASGGSGAHEGSAFFYSVSSAIVHAYQDINIPSKYWTAIDAGLIGAKATYWQQSFDTDTGGVSLHARDAGSLNTLGLYAIETAEPSWAQKTPHIQTLPVGTRVLRVQIDMHRNLGTQNDGYVDDIHLYLTDATKDDNFATVQALIFTEAPVSGSPTSFIEKGPDGRTVAFSGTPAIVSSPSFGTRLTSPKNAYNSVDIVVPNTDYMFINPATGDFQIPASTEVSFECYAQFDTLPSAGNAMTLMSMTNATGNQRGWAFDIFNNAGTRQLRFLVSTTGASFDKSAVATWVPSTATPYHIAFTRDYAGVSRLFVDGVVQTLTTDTIGANACFNSTADVWFGRLGNSANGLDGKLGMARVNIGYAYYNNLFVPATDYPRRAA